MKDHREGNLGVCSPLQLPRRPGPSGRRYWALVPPILQHRGLVLCSPSPSLQRDPGTAPCIVLLPPESTSFTLDTESLLSLGARAGRASPSWGTGAAFSPLCPSCSCSCPEQAAGQSRGDTERGETAPETLVSVWDISSAMGSVVVSC